jgi:superfamily II DNA or RNA helicase
VDYFELDESYTELLGTVDYYIPTPAIVKSGRLAPYSDLVYIVPPDANLSKLLEEKEKKLQEFISIHKTEICIFLHEFLIENFSRLEVKSLDLLEKWMRFIYVYKTESLDMGSYITGNANKPITLEDIAKSIGKWGADGFKKTKTSSLLKEIKELFFDL